MYKIEPLINTVILLESVIREEDPSIDDKTLREEVRDRFAYHIEESFFCERNSDIITFLKTRAIDGEIRNSTRTFMISDESFNWLGFFTIAIKNLDISDISNNQKKSFIFRGKSPKTVSTIPSFLLAQIAKNDKHSGQICGKDIMDEALKYIERARAILGGKIAILDSVNNDKVIKFYKEYGFEPFGNVIESKNGDKLQPMVLKFKDVL